MTQLTFERLRDAVAGDAVALRSRMTLQPAGGEGDKIFPPSYDSGGRAEYAVEERQVGGGDEVSTTVLLDSVASQANRAELALLDGWERGELVFPVPYVDFSDDGGRDGLREADGAGGTPPAGGCDLPGQPAPRNAVSPVRRRSCDYRCHAPRNATDLFRYSPTSLLFGMWDSTGPKGGLGSKFQRAYVSEIVGLRCSKWAGRSAAGSIRCRSRRSDRRIACLQERGPE